MPKALEKVAKDALNLPSRHRMMLAGLRLETVDSAGGDIADTAWKAEIRNRVRAIEEDRVEGVAYEEVLVAAEARLAL